MNGAGTDTPDAPTAEDDEERPLEAAAAGAATSLVFLVGFGLMFAGVPYFWVAFPVGFAGFVPLVVGLTKYYEQRRARSSTVDAAGEQSDVEDALAELRRRYARGEFDEAEFERRVERLLETESVAEARGYVEHVRDANGDDREGAYADERA